MCPYSPINILADMYGSLRAGPGDLKYSQPCSIEQHKTALCCGYKIDKYKHGCLPTLKCPEGGARRR